MQYLVGCMQAEAASATSTDHCDQQLTIDGE